MATYYKVTGTTDPHTNWTTRVVLSRDEETGEEKVVEVGKTVDLTAEERDKVKGFGLVVEESSKSEAEEEKKAAESEQTTGDDVAAAGPVFGRNRTNDQNS